MRADDIAARPDLTIGEVMISPSRRRIEGPGGVVQIEPRTMQVFLLLFDAAGRVVTRNELFDQCWGGAMVGDDSLNRAIGKVRRIAAEVAPGFFEVETIPRTGYRLVGDILTSSEAKPDSSMPANRVGRRALIAGAAAAVGAGALGWRWTGLRKDREFKELMARGDETLAYREPSVNSSQYFERAVALRPDDAAALGRLAYSRTLRVESGSEADAADSVREAQQVLRATLAIDPAEPFGRLAEIVLQRSTLDFAATEDRLRAVLASAPDNIHAMRQLWELLQCVGRSQEGLAMVERAIGVSPLAASNNFPKAQFLWIVGRTAEADRVIDRAMQFWPAHRFVRFARFTILAFTGRARAALAMLDNKDTTPQNFSPASVALWRQSLPALDDRSPANLNKARQANVAAASQNLQLASQAVMTLASLGDLDSAFAIADALYAVRAGSARDRSAPGARSSGSSTAWRFTPWLFVPPTAAVRADPRFAVICDGIGLTDYWAKRRLKPDYQTKSI